MSTLSDEKLEIVDDAPSPLQSTAGVFARKHSLSVDQVMIFRHTVDSNWDLIVLATDEREPRVRMFFTDGTTVTEPLRKLSDGYAELLMDLTDVTPIKSRIDEYMHERHDRTEHLNRTAAILIGLGLGATAIGLVTWWRR